MTRRKAFCLLSAGMFAVISCGYRTGGKADLVPQSIRTIYIPAFASTSVRYKLVDLLPQQVGREFIARTRFRIVDNPSDADAVLNGNVNAAQTFVTIVDPTSNKATSVQVSVVVTINFQERATGRILYSRPNLAFRQNYNIAVDPHQFFDESGPALDRVSRDLAHDLVSAIVENF